MEFADGALRRPKSAEFFAPGRYHALKGAAHDHLRSWIRHSPGLTRRKPRRGKNGTQATGIRRGVGIDNIVNYAKVYAMAALDIYRRKKESLAKSQLVSLSPLNLDLLNGSWLLATVKWRRRRGPNFMVSILGFLIPLALFWQTKNHIPYPAGAFFSALRDPKDKVSILSVLLRLPFRLPLRSP